MSHKKKRGIIDKMSGQRPSETGYSISVVQTPEGTKVKAKVGKNTDANMLRKQLQQKYPNAEIEIEGGKKEPLIREISTRTLRHENRETNRTKG